MLVWIDLEASSLVTTAAVLEVAVIMTDDQLLEVARFHRVVHWPLCEQLAHLRVDSPEEMFTHATTAYGLDPVVVQMHTRNGLWHESALSRHSLAQVDDQLAEFLGEPWRKEGEAKPQIAGSSIWFDRGLMAVSLPRALKQLHYRSVDVTTLNEMARRFWPRLHQGVPNKRELHRAMPDIEDSLGLCRYYAEKIAALDETAHIRPVGVLEIDEAAEALVGRMVADNMPPSKKRILTTRIK